MKVIDSVGRYSANVKEQQQVYNAYINLLNRRKNAKVIKYILIKIIWNDQNFFMFWNILPKNDVKFVKELSKLLDDNDNNIDGLTFAQKICASTTEGDIIIRDEEDFYCALILYLNKCSGEELENPMKITVISILV